MQPKNEKVKNIFFIIEQYKISLIVTPP